MLLSTHLRRNTPRQREQGYILLFLLLTIALMAMVFSTLVTSIKFDIKRDREEEMIHRGVQYTRAIRAYYRKFNRFPAKIEDLENTNQLRFLRKRYKDPLTGKDFKLVHFGEVKFSGGLGGGTIPGASTVGANGQLTSTGFGQNSGFGSNNNMFSTGPAVGQNSAFGQNSGFGQNSNSAFGQNQPSNSQTSGSDSPQTPPGTPGSDASDGSQQVQSNGANGAGSPNQQVFGGAPIVGVASTSKDKTIREFDKKKKYNEWMFVYDPMLDRGGLIKTPYQPQLMMQMMGQGMQNLNGQPNQNGNNGFGNSGFGNNNGFGNSNGFGNGFGSSTPGAIQNSPGGYVNSAPPPNNSPQQQ